MYSDINSLTIDTPENIELNAEIAGFGSRCIAAIVDYLILIVVGLIVAYLYFRALSQGFRGSSWAIATLVGIEFIIVTFYHLFFEFLWNGQTPGKRLFGLRVVQSDGLPLTTSGALIRNLLRLFDFLPLLYGIGLVALFATKQTQRLGDLAARTIVIRERQQLKLENVKEDFTVTYHHISRTDPLPSNMQIGELSEDDRRDVVNYLQRRKDLRRREYIVGMLATRIARKMGNTTIISDFSSPNVAERFLEQVARGFELETQPQP
ncbi:MAG: RDD family protein [Chloroflexota bacterium]